MTIEQVIAAYQDKEDAPCPITDQLVKAGYQQQSGGYIADAIALGMEVDYEKALPSQWWHLMYYCQAQDKTKVFPKSIVCGELIFWMAEAARCVATDELRALADEIIDNNTGTIENPYYQRKQWNARIQKLCFDAIKSFVENKENEHDYITYRHSSSGNQL